MKLVLYLDLQLAIAHHRRQVAPCAPHEVFVLEGPDLSIRSNAEQRLGEGISFALHGGASMHPT